MTTHGSRGCGTNGCRQGACVEQSSMGSMPQLNTSKTVGTPTTETEFGAQTIKDDALSQAMLRVPERVSRTHIGSGS